MPVAIGNTTPQANTDELNANAKLVIAVTPGVTGRLARIWMYLDGNGTGVGNAPIRGIVYADSAALPAAQMGFGSDITIADGQAFGWVELPMILQPYIYQPTQQIWIGGHPGPGATSGNTIQAKRAAGGTARSQNANDDTFSDGSADPFGTTQVPSQALYSIYAEIINDPPPPTPRFVYSK
jgi:hypothetical protein